MKNCIRAALAAALLVGAAHRTQADVTVVSEVNVTGQPPRQGPGPSPVYPQTVTTYYKGDMARSEVAGGPVTIYDSAGGKVYRLDPNQKTYFVMPLTPGAGGPGRGGRPKPVTTLTLTGGTETQTLAGITAKNYTLAGSVKAPTGGPPPGGGNFGGPPRGGGGGFGGGRRGQPNVTVTGDVWLSATAKLPTDAATLPAADELLPGVRPLVTPLAEALGKTHFLPLLAKITVTPDAPPAPPDGQDAPPAPKPTMITVTVKSVSSASLQGSLFTVPQGYTEMPPPMGPQGGHGGGFGGPPPDGGMGGPPPDGGFGGPPNGGPGMDGPPPPDGGGPPM